MPKTIDEVKEAFRLSGISISEWSRQNGFSHANVRSVLSGARALRGESHRIAVTLGLKDGIICDYDELMRSLQEMRGK